MLVLLRARQAADSFDLDIWQFAVDLSDLVGSGLTKTDCRTLVCGGFVCHAREISMAGEGKRTFQNPANLTFGYDSCFVLTDRGESVLAKLRWLDDATSTRSGVSQETPRWDQERHELWFGDIVIKRFRQPAPNQEKILDAFQEENWPRRIDDPLGPRAGYDPKRRLHDTIVSLNRNQKGSSVRFFGDGTGQGVCWEIADDSEEIASK